MRTLAPEGARGRGGPGPGRRRSGPAALAGVIVAAVCAVPGAAQVPVDGPEGPGGGSVYPVDPMALPRPSIEAVKVGLPVTIDGLLDEEAWGRAVANRDTWIQTLPEPGMPASQETILRIIYDETHLYIGAVLFDEDPYHLSVPGLEQDFDTPNSDIFGVALDTYLDRKNGFLWAVNPAGAVFDAQAFNDQQEMSVAWEGIVEARTSLNDSSWVVEMAIPFATLRFDPAREEQIWGVNFSRRIRRRNEDALWAPLPVQFRVYKFSLAGTLEGLSNLPRARNLWIKPYALGDRFTGSRYDPSETDGDIGVDAKWGLTPRMTLDLTVNTDFSQVEVDAEQVNLTRFSLFFPERRDFFLENEGTFTFSDISLRNYRTGSNSRNFRLFNSRRIGLSPTREPLPIGGGARLTGRIGDRLEVGFLNMQTRSFDGLSDGSDYDAENFSVARVKSQFGPATVGGMFINRQETGGPDPSAFNRSYGVDLNVQATRDLVLSAYWARTDDDTPVGPDANIGMFQAAWRNVFWNASTLVKHVGDGFQPETGFVDRVGVRRYYGTLGVHPRVNRWGIREFNPYVEADLYTNLREDVETRTLRGGLVVDFLAGGQFSATLADRYERLFEETPIGGALVGPGTYEWLEPQLRLSTPGNLPVFVSGGLQWGDFYDGSRRSVSADVTVRPNEHIALELGAQRNDLVLGGEDFNADLYSARLRFAANTRLFFLTFAQYNESTDELIINARVNLMHAPLSDVFLVYTERRSLADGVADPLLERGFTLKVTKLFAF